MQGVEFVLKKEGRAMIADEMGLGKTIQVSYQQLKLLPCYLDGVHLLYLCEECIVCHFKRFGCAWFCSTTSCAKTSWA